MDTEANPVGDELTELYASKINYLIAQGRESLISGLVEEYDDLRREAASSHERAA